MPLLPLVRLYSHLQHLVEQRLWAKVLLGLALGVGVGVVLGPSVGWFSPAIAATITNWLALPGNLFIGLVQMIMIPLVVASIIQGISGGGRQADMARTGVRIGLYFLVTTVVSIGVGVGAALLIQPGAALGAHVKPVAVALTTAGAAPTRTAADLPSIISNLLPRNPLASMLAGEMLSIVIFSVIVGAALVAIPRASADPMLKLLFSVQEICMTVTRWAMKLAPIAVFGLMARVVASAGLGAITGLGVYVLTVLGALALLVGMYVLILLGTRAVAVGYFFRSSKDVLLLAFSVASSAAVMPLTMKTAEEKFQVPPSLSRFVVPLGAIINMNGTAAYQAVATIFLAQVYGMELGLPAIALVVVTTVAASIGTPSAPGAGIVILASVLGSVGVPIEGIALIMGVDHLLGMCRTTVNVAGDLTACVVFAKGASAEQRDGADATQAQDGAGALGDEASRQAT